jgi:hypothetical protein
LVYPFGTILNPKASSVFIQICKSKTPGTALNSELLTKNLILKRQIMAAKEQVATDQD